MPDPAAAPAPADDLDARRRRLRELAANYLDVPYRAECPRSHPGAYETVIVGDSGNVVALPGSHGMTVTVRVAEYLTLAANLAPDLDAALSAESAARAAAEAEVARYQKLAADADAAKGGLTINMELRWFSDANGLTLIVTGPKKETEQRVGKSAALMLGHTVKLLDGIARGIAEEERDAEKQRADQAEADRDAAKAVAESLAERVAKQSELLGRRVRRLGAAAERRRADQLADRVRELEAALAAVSPPPGGPRG